MTERSGAEPVGPEYGGSKDRGVSGSVPAGHDALGDVVGVLRSERQKLDQVFESVLRELDAGATQAVRTRWGGIVREVLEHLVAVERVLEHPVPRDLRRSLEQSDSFTPDVTPEQVRAVVDGVRAELQRQEQELVPRLEALDQGERDRLGEDLRQTAG